MKDFLLELGKDFLFYDKEYPLQVGNSTFKIDLLFFHRGLQCLVANLIRSMRVYITGSTHKKLGKNLVINNSSICMLIICVAQ